MDAIAQPCLVHIAREEEGVNRASLEALELNQVRVKRGEPENSKPPKYVILHKSFIRVHLSAT